jgi:hypothetical protein
MEHLAKIISTIQLSYSIHSESQPLLSSCHLLNFARNLKLIFSLLPFLHSLNIPQDPPGLLLWFLTMALCFSFIVIFICHSPLPHSLLFTLWPNLVLLNKHAFLCLAPCNTLNPPQSHLCLMFTSFHIISYFSFSPHNFC